MSKRETQSKKDFWPVRSGQRAKESRKERKRKEEREIEEREKKETEKRKRAKERAKKGDGEKERAHLFCRLFLVLVDGLNLSFQFVNLNIND